MNGCNDCKYKKGFDCIAPRSQWKFFDRDKGVERVCYKSRSWQRADKKHCDDHEPKEIPLIIKWWRGLWR